MLIKLTRAMLFRGAVLWPGTILELPAGVAIDMVKDQHAVPVPRQQTSPETWLATGERRGS